MGSGCGGSIVDKILRPPGKLPVPVALNALSLTLFNAYYTRFYRKWQLLFYRYFGNDFIPVSNRDKDALLGQLHFRMLPRKRNSHWPARHKLAAGPCPPRILSHHSCRFPAVFGGFPILKNVQWSYLTF